MSIRDRRRCRPRARQLAEATEWRWGRNIGLDQQRDDVRHTGHRVFPGPIVMILPSERVPTVAAVGQAAKPLQVHEAYGFPRLGGFHDVGFHRWFRP